MGIYSENKTVSSPVTKYIQWSSTKDCFEYYDKEKEDKVDVKLPVSFIALDDFFGVTGGAMDDGGVFHPVQSGIAAHINKQIVVKKDGVTFAQGTWKEVKDSVKSEGGRFTAYVFAIMKGKGKKSDELVCFKLAGAALAAWFGRSNGDFITVEKSQEMKKGAITYKSPVFNGAALSEDELTAINETEEAKAFLVYAEAKRAQKMDGEGDAEAQHQPGRTPQAETNPQPNLDDDFDASLEDVEFESKLD